MIQEVSVVDIDVNFSRASKRAQQVRISTVSGSPRIVLGIHNLHLQMALASCGSP